MHGYQRLIPTHTHTHISAEDFCLKKKCRKRRSSMQKLFVDLINLQVDSYNSCNPDITEEEKESGLTEHLDTLDRAQGKLKKLKNGAVPSVLNR
ncbi:hypothetical protein WN51_09283 [Melipona quadrifasciata]|uniref:Uncharacterized protein n=1 Tax=Melipona quadrifasciata TaxID=166423 RepID=A0A0N0BIF9_9HYME|nr:hypothetical protein WN51_09283 [Melipona quadrifasciata]